MNRKGGSTDEATALIEHLSDAVPPAWQRLNALDARFRHQLARLDDIRAALAEAPEQAPPPGTWDAVVARFDARVAARRRWKGGLTAVAAVFVGGVGAALLIAASGDRAVEEPIAVADLISESQRLERARLAVALDPRAWTDRERGLALRISDVDAQLSGLPARGGRDRRDVENLWETRVDLLHALMEEERAARAQYTVY